MYSSELPPNVIHNHVVCSWSCSGQITRRVARFSRCSRHFDRADTASRQDTGTLPSQKHHTYPHLVDCVRQRYSVACAAFHESDQADRGQQSSELVSSPCFKIEVILHHKSAGIIMRVVAFSSQRCPRAQAVSKAPCRSRRTRCMATSTRVAQPKQEVRDRRLATRLSMSRAFSSIKEPRQHCCCVRPMCCAQFIQ